MATKRPQSPPAATASSSDNKRPPLDRVLPPLILGTATFNTQYVSDPLSMPYHDIVRRAIELGVNAFDTSPYYGPSEVLLGSALAALMNPSDPTTTKPLARESFTIVTKCGRIKGDEFDYTPEWTRYSIYRSLQRLHTPYLDLVYAHDVEFVSPQEVLAVVKELRRLRDEEGVVRYVGISGFPVGVLCGLAEYILTETGEPLDAVLSYGHFTVQNRQLGLPWVDQENDGKNTVGSPLARLKAAGVNVVLNASMLGMGLLTSKGIPPDPEAPVVAVIPDGEKGAIKKEEAKAPSPLAVWHPSPPALRLACKKLAEISAAAGERLESVAIRWALDEWVRVAAAADVGTTLATPGEIPLSIGATVCGVSSITELEETVKEWREVVENCRGNFFRAEGTERALGEYHSERSRKILELVKNELWPALGAWRDFAWASPSPGYVNTRRAEDRGKVPDDGVMAAHEGQQSSKRRRVD